MLPWNEGTEQTQGIAPVADKIIIHEKETAAPPQAVQQIEFCQHLLRGFGSRHSAVELGNIAKLAIKRASTRKLQQHRAVIAHVDEIIAWQGGLGNRRPLPWHIEMLGSAVLKVVEKAREGFFDLAQEKVINVFHVFPIGGWVWSTGYHRLASTLGTSNDVLQRLPLDNHRGSADQVSPQKIVVRQGLDIHVNQAQVVVLRKHVGECE